MGLDVKVRSVMKGLPDAGFLDYLEERHPKLRKNFQDGTKLIGNECHSLTLSDTGGYDDEGPPTTIVEEYWRLGWRHSIVWFNELGPSEVAMVHMAYSNEPSLEWHYSSAAILVQVPVAESELREKVIKG